MRRNEEPARVDLRFNLQYCHWGSKAMTSGIQNKAQGSATPGRGIASGLAFALVVCLLVLWPASSFAGPRAWGRQRAQAARVAPVRPAPMRAQAGKPAGNQNGNGKGNAAGNSVPRPAFGGNPAAMRPGVNEGARPGHLGDWLNNHRNLTPQQQEEELRREPGFNRLSPDQQQRVLNRLHTLEAHPVEQQQRMADRVEMFEHLTPEQKADVHASSSALAAMPGDRQALVRRAFIDLRQIPPDQRTQILNSARFSQTFSPQERHVLGSMLSIEPYPPR
jgi:hypothetical protein